MNSSYQDFRAAAVKAGIAQETVSILSDAYRDSEQHAWAGQALDWCGNPAQLIERALESPEKIAAVCSYFFASDGGEHREGLQYLPGETIELAEQILCFGWGVEIDAAVSCFFVKVNDSRHSKLEYLKGPRSPTDVKKLGYSFTTTESEAWPFPTRKQAQTKARILDRHMGWGLGISTVEPANLHQTQV